MLRILATLVLVGENIVAVLGEAYIDMFSLFCVHRGARSSGAAFCVPPYDKSASSYFPRVQCA
jgi:hypothetical protein